MANQEKPFSSAFVTRFLVTLAVALSLMAGFYHTALTLEQRKYLRLEDMYVRVRGELGREETQRLIDQSYEKDHRPEVQDW